MIETPAYYLIAVSTRENLRRCLDLSLAGFTSSGNGVWAYVDIAEGDFVSFLYGATVFNLYRVTKKYAIANADQSETWPPLHFRMSGQTYYFPFRLQLEQVRELRESLVRAEFAYVAENLLLRGGYAKTHFQADQTTLQAVSQMGDLVQATSALLAEETEKLVPRFGLRLRKSQPPTQYVFDEKIIHSVIKRYLTNGSARGRLVDAIGASSLREQNLEILGERALPEGHIDILIKEATPFGTARKIVLEVKKGDGKALDIGQLRGYTETIGEECAGAGLVARSFTPRLIRAIKDAGFTPLVYGVGADLPELATFEEICAAFRLLAA